MADSHDKYGRIRRDMFRAERGSGGGDKYRSGSRGDDRSRGRDDWQERQRSRYREDRRYGGGRRDGSDGRSSGNGRGGSGRFSSDRGGRFSPDRYGSPMKRMRTERADDSRPRYGGRDAYRSYGGRSVSGGQYEYPIYDGHGFGGGYRSAGWLPRRNVKNPGSNSKTANSRMLALKYDFKSYSNAIIKYNKDKEDFRREQLKEFFVTYKDDDWFMNKYHPEESFKRNNEKHILLKRRAEVFVELLDNGAVTAVNVDSSQAEKLLRLLDTVVIKLEGGTDEDLKVLDNKIGITEDDQTKINMFSNPFARTPNETTLSTFHLHESEENRDDEDDQTKINMFFNPFSRTPNETTLSTFHLHESEENRDDEDDQTKIKMFFNPFARKPNETTPPTFHPLESEENWDDEEDVMTVPSETSKDDTAPTQNNSFARKLEQDWSTLPMNEVNPMPRNDDDEQSTGEKKPIPAIESPKADEKKINDDDEAVKTDQTKQCERSESHSRENIDEDNGNAKITQIDGDANDAVVNEVPQQDSENIMLAEKIDEAEDNKKEDGEDLIDCETSVKKEEDAVETIELDKGTVPKDDQLALRALHKTSSIFVRSLAPRITKSEVESMFNRYNGFLRVAISEPLADRRWFRRGWVTFQRDVNVEEICRNLRKSGSSCSKLGVIVVNRELCQRVRTVYGIAAHKTIVRNHIKLCAKIAFNLDLKAGLWQSDGNSKKPDTSDGSFDLNTDNPVLQNITQYLIEEASTEEDELLGISAGQKNDTDGELLDRDPVLVAVLDKLILYLRIVHSMDFYNHCQYPLEDEMPNRCGILHARGPAPLKEITQANVKKYIRNFECGISSFLAKSQAIDDVELKKLGFKDIDAEIERFVLANTQKLDTGKWLCHLSGKRFNGPDFIRKHILNKHGEKVDAVKKDVEYFNNYLSDPQRPQYPQLPEYSQRPTAASWKPW